MQTNENLKNSLQTEERPTKRVKFSEDTKDNPVFTPLAKPHASAVRKVWVKRFRDGDYEQLKKDLISYEDRGMKIENFFNKEGRALLDWAISSVPSAEPLRFICDNVPKELLKDMLSSKNHSMVNTLLLGQTGMEELNKLTPSRLENLFKKFKYLLSIDFDGVSEFLKNSLSKNGVGDKIKDSIRQILSETLSKSNQSSIYE